MLQRRWLRRGAKVLFEGAPRFHEFVLETAQETAEETNAALLEQQDYWRAAAGEVVSGVGRKR